MNLISRTLEKPIIKFKVIIKPNFFDTNFIENVFILQSTFCCKYYFC